MVSFKMKGFTAAAVAGSLIVAPLFNGLRTVNAEQAAPTTTPIKHVVVIFQENVSFDHYFGTYLMRLIQPDSPCSRQHRVRRP